MKRSNPLLFSLLLGLLAGLLFIGLSTMSEALGGNIPSLNVSSDYAKGLVWAILLLAGIALFPFPLQERWALCLLWVIKIGVTLIFMLYYEHVYRLDAFHYFQMSAEKISFPSENLTGTTFIYWLTGQIRSLLPFMDSYHALKVIWAFAGLMGVFLFYKGFCEYVGVGDRRLLWLLGFYPSILFWSSILGKDPLTFLAIAMFFYGALGTLRGQVFPAIIFMALGLGLMSVIRMWLTALFLIPFAIAYLSSGKSSLAGKLVGAAVTAAVAFQFSSGVMQTMNIGNQADLLAKTQVVSRSWSHGGSGSGSEVPQFGSFAELIAFLPKGITAALFRPLPGEINNLFGIISGLENAMLIVLMIFALSKASRKDFFDTYIRYSILTLLIWSSFYGFLCYQNMGTAVRFKLQILPILVLLPIYVIKKAEQTEQKEVVV